MLSKVGEAVKLLGLMPVTEPLKMAAPVTTRVSTVALVELNV
jgi:hypothetical protein